MAKPPQRTSQNRDQKSQPEQPDPIVEEVERKLEPVLSNLSKVQREQVISKVSVVLRSEAFSGPIPPPRYLREYDEIVHGSAQQLINMARDAHDHNMGVTTKQQDSDNTYRMLGMWLGFVALLVLIVSAVVAGLFYNNIGLSALLLGAAALGTIPTFVNGRIHKSNGAS